MSLFVTVLVSAEKLFHFRQHWRNYDSIESYLRARTGFLSNYERVFIKAKSGYPFDELNQLISAFEDNNLDYAVCGGLSMAIHGFARATLDIDILIQPDTLEEAFRVGEEHGYDIHGLDISFKERAVEIRRVSKIDSNGEVLSLDLLLVTPQVEDVWDNKRKGTFSGPQTFRGIPGGIDKNEDTCGQAARPGGY